MTVHDEVALVVLAAGRGERMGGVAKALLRTGERSFLETIDASCPVADKVLVVAAPFAELVSRHGVELGFRVVHNPAPERGMGSSVGVGFSALVGQSRAAVAVLWPVDCPFVSPSTVAALINEATDEAIVIPTVDGRGGHPCVVGRKHWQAMSGAGVLKEGARTVFRENAAFQHRVEVTDHGVLRDVDRVSDLTGDSNPLED